MGACSVLIKQAGGEGCLELGVWAVGYGESVSGSKCGRYAICEVEVGVVGPFGTAFLPMDRFLQPA